MDVTTIDQESKARYWQLATNLGRPPTFSEQLDISTWYRTQHQTLIDERKKGEEQKQRAEMAEEKGERWCETCGGVIERTGKRGRPRRWHEECRPEKPYSYQTTQNLTEETADDN